LDYQKLGGLLTKGGTILGTANRGRFSAKVGHGESRRLPQELIDGVKIGMEKLSIRALVSIGGDGSLSIGQQLVEGGVPLVGVPKTIDNDLDRAERRRGKPRFLSGRPGPGHAGHGQENRLYPGSGKASRP